MRKQPPPLEALIGTHVSGLERDRFTRAHEALLEAGPLPELPSSLRQPPAVTRRRFPVRPPAGSGLRYVAAAAATLLLAAGALAYGLSSGPSGMARRTFAMHATAAAPLATATVRVGSRDRAGNWPITLRVRGLPRLPRGGYYEMFLTNKGRPVASCGRFRTDGGTTVVQLNAPFRLGEYSGWTITREGPHQPPSQPLLTTTPA